jgi:hypothetical protein
MVSMSFRRAIECAYCPSRATHRRRLIARTRLNETDEGKKVIDSDGTEAGVISGFRGGQAYVDPDPSIADSVLSTPGWSNVDEHDYALDNSGVETITDDEVHLDH